ncbi:MAG: polysaccharide deacetylase family protein [Candidatus Methanoperedens sp.]|nr:polysaccharide deacetylase family protein [Candidatus Methanoperedens sp.]
MTMGLRVDVDSIADAMAVPELLDLLKKYHSKATFFITTGPDETLRNISHYTGKNLLSIPLKRYIPGFFQSIIRRNVESHQALQVLINSGHEIGIHGYRHYEWMNFLHKKNIAEISNMIETGCKLFEKVFGIPPRSFSSPGFTTSKEYLLALDDFDFDYSSDFYGFHPFNPQVGDKKFGTLQLPVTIPSPCELQDDDEKIIRNIRELCKKDHFILYIHPSCELLYRRELLESILECAGNTQLLREIYENTSDIRP